MDKTMIGDSFNVRLKVNEVFYLIIIMSNQY